MNIIDSPQFEIFFVFFAYHVAFAAFFVVVYDILFLGLGLSIVECFKILQEKIANLNLKGSEKTPTIFKNRTTTEALQNRNFGELVEKHHKLLRHGKIFCECFQLSVFMRFLTVGGSICILGFTILKVAFSKSTEFCMTNN